MRELCEDEDRVAAMGARTARGISVRMRERGLEQFAIEAGPPIVEECVG